MTFQPLAPDAGRICDALTQSRFTPLAALRDIMDNTANTGAKGIVIRIVRENKALSLGRRDNVREYLLLDDGMSENGIKNALTLGSSKADYGPETLSKFGLGLKSASFSQGGTLELVSSDGAGPLRVQHFAVYPRRRLDVAERC